MGHIRYLYYYVESRDLVEDLSQDYFASYNLLNNESIYSNNNIQNILNNMKLKPTYPNFSNYHPPFISILYIPFTFFSYHTSFLMINFLTITFSMLFCYILTKKHKIHFLTLVVLFFFPNYYFATVSMGNINWLIFLIIAIIWYIEYYPINQKNLLYSDTLIGFLISLATFIKIFPSILILYFFLQKRKNILISFTISSVLLLILTFSIINTDDIILYYTKISKEDLIIYAPFFGNISIIVISIVLFGWQYPLLDFLELNPYFNRPELTFPTYIIGCIIILLLNILTSIKYNKNHNELIFSLWLVSMLLLSPVSWLSLGTILFIPLILIWKYDKINRLFVFLSYILISLNYSSIFHTFSPNGKYAPPNLLILLPPLTIIFIYFMIIYTIYKSSKN